MTSGLYVVVARYGTGFFSLSLSLSSFLFDIVVSESMFESAALSFRCSRVFSVVFINFLSSLLKPFLCSFGERKN